jgi:SAM-dependent methyltransferase
MPGVGRQRRREKIQGISKEVGMTTDQYSHLVNAQYGRHNLGESILAALRAIGKDPGNVTLGDLAPLDHFHGGGYPATLELARRVTFQQGSALALPFPDHSFDVVWAQNSFMNIADKEDLYAGIYRVLRAEGAWRSRR